MPANRSAPPDTKDWGGEGGQGGFPPLASLQNQFGNLQQLSLIGNSLSRLFEFSPRLPVVLLPLEIDEQQIRYSPAVFTSSFLGLPYSSWFSSGPSSLGLHVNNSYNQLKVWCAEFTDVDISIWQPQDFLLKLNVQQEVEKMLKV